MTELVLLGNAVDGDNRRAWLERTWDELITEQAHKLAGVWPGRKVPPAIAWPGYVATRTRLLRRLEQLVTTRTGGASSGTVSDTPLPWIERRLVDTEHSLYGTPDLVEIRDGRLRVVDLKTGVHQGEVRHGQRRQLLLYAHLVQATLGRAVDEAAVVDVRGREQLVETNRDDIDGLIAEVTAARDAFHRSSTSGSFPAKPDATVCGRCAYRIVCEPYWHERRPEWLGVGVAGMVTSIHEHGVVDVGEGDDRQRVVLTEGVAVAVSDEIAVVDLDGAGPGTWRMRWDSLIRINDDSP